MTDILASELAHQLSEREGWLRVMLERDTSRWQLRYGNLVVGPEPATWPAASWRYESVAFHAMKVAATSIAEWFNAESDTQIKLGEFDVDVPRVQSRVQVRHRASFELHDRDRSPMPSFEYAITREGGPAAGASTAGRLDFLVGPDSPSFTDLDSAFRAFFLGVYDLPANASVPSEVMHLRVVDDRSWLGQIHITATRMTVDVQGTDFAGTSLEYFSPVRRERVGVDAPGVITFDLPDGLAASNTWLWLTAGTSWRDYRALTAPWASEEQLRSAGVEREQTSRDEAAVEAIVYGGEGPFVEFKASLPTIGARKTDRAFNTIAAFANGAGGTVVFGVDRDELTVLGLPADVELNKERDRLGQLIRTRILPTPDFRITSHVISGKTIFFVNVMPGGIPPYGVITDLDHRDKPQFYVRRGASTYPAQPSDLNELFQRVAAAQATDGWRP